MKFTHYWFLRLGLHYIAIGILVSSACPSKITGRVSPSSCLFVWFPGGDGSLPTPHCLEMPPRHLYATASHQGTKPQKDVGWGCPVVIFLGNRSQGGCCERGEAFPPEGSEVVSQPEAPSHCDSRRSRTRSHPWASFLLHFPSKRERETTKALLI